jgi:outer membrane protein assembly factor BamB
MRTSLLISTLALALAGASAGAAVTKSFRQTSAKDFEEGEATASMILPEGAVVPGMKPSSIALEAAFVWCSTLSPDGRTAYFGTGDEGRIYAVDVASNQAQARRVAALDAAWITALAARPDGTLVVGTTPGGRIYSVDPKSGSSRLFATLGVEHVWALVLDPKTGAVYAGTGGPGKIFEIDPSGRARELWDSGDKHVVSLIQADATHLYAGTSEEAILFRVGLDGRTEAVADFDAEEVRALGRSGGALYAAVNDFERTTSAPAVVSPGSHGTKITVAPSGSPASAGSLPRPGQRKAKAGLYRIEPDGHLEQIFSLGDGYLTALAFDDDGRVFVASGTEGRVYRVDADRQAALAIDLPERQALTLVRSGRTFLVGTGDVGGLYRVVAAASRQATYLSRVLDAEFRARFGLLRWNGAHGLDVETRSGNTARPDPTWSPFAGLDRLRATAEGGAGLVASPAARYVQYRVTFGAADARLEAVTLAYLAQNQRARITELTVGDSAAAAAIGASGLGGVPVAFPTSPSATSGTTRTHSAVVKLRWKVENPDGDELDYRLAFRQANEAVWRPLGGPDPLPKSEYDWNTEGLPDGNYLVRVAASDERSEARERALETSFTSTPILVDNRKPEVVGLVARYPYLSGRARDDQSPLTGLEYAIDGGDWQILTVADGICDDLVEAFTLKLPSLALGPHAVTVRAWDSADNVGAAAVTVTVTRESQGKKKSGEAKSQMTDERTTR